MMIISPFDPEKPCTDDALSSLAERVCYSGAAAGLILMVGILLYLWDEGLRGKAVAVAFLVASLVGCGILACVIFGVNAPPPDPYVPFASSVPPEALSVAYDSGTVTFTNLAIGTITRIEMVQSGLLSSTSLYSVDLAHGESASFPVADLDEVRVSKIDGNTTEFARYHISFGRDSEGRNIVRIS